MFKFVLMTFPCMALAFHVQIGVSGSAHRYDASTGSESTQWRGFTAEVGAVPERFPYGICRIGLGELDCGFELDMEGGGTFTIRQWASTIVRPDPSERSFDASAVVTLGRLGANRGNVVFTMRGDPYSLVVNDTDADRMVNGVTIERGAGRRLPFPVALAMDAVEGARFWDLASGAEIPAFRNQGAYVLSYTGDIRITGGRPPGVPIEPLVYGDMVGANSDRLLYAMSEVPVYANGVTVTTNISLNTWWDFDQESWDGETGPTAMINGEPVCVGHSTGHIIDYVVSTDGMKVYGGVGYVDFTMSQIPGDGSSGGSCAMRCWDASVPDYNDASDTHKAESTAGVSAAARFRLSVNIRTGTWSVHPL